MKAPSTNDRHVKVRAYLTDEDFGYEHWRAAQFSAPTVPSSRYAVLTIFDTKAERDASLLSETPPAEWQDIETHDGSPMPVLVAEGQDVVEAAYSAEHDVWWELNSCDDGSPGSDRRVNPTHWMPLPKAPVLPLREVKS